MKAMLEQKTEKTPPSKGPSLTEQLRASLKRPARAWLLLSWDIDGLQASVLSDPARGIHLASASSTQPRFADALNEVLETLGRLTPVRPQQVALAARHLLPALVNLPVAPDKPRPPAQMRELVQAEMEPGVAEFGSLWSLGALLETRGHLTAEERERIMIEESMRREGKHTPLRYGETALELDLIDRATLDACLEIQEGLQHLDTTLISGWRGRIEDKQPLWLACATGNTHYESWQEALSEHKLKLSATLPLTWLVSESDGQPDTGGRRDNASQIALELHREEVVAVRRQHGKIVSARSESRMERPLGPDWLARLVADWVSEGRCSLELVCLHPDDEAAAAGISDDLALCTGQTVSLRSAAESRYALWHHLYLQASAAESSLPRIVARELRGSLWANHDIRRLAVLGAIVLVLGGVEAWQRYAIYKLDSKMEASKKAEQEKAKSAQQQLQFNNEMLELGKDLDATRKKLEPLINERERMNILLAMRHNLPELLAMMAQAVGSDAVLESVRNSKGNGNATSIQVVAWSPSYTGAQAFADRVGEMSRSLGYGVVQTEIIQRQGRDRKAGHEVNFWLQPEADDLDGAPLAPALPATPAQTGVSAVLPKSTP